jgi:hypothetical protein
MTLPAVNYLAVLVAGIVIFVLGGLWYSPVLFARRWMALMGKTETELKAGASGSFVGVLYLLAFLSGLVTAWAMAVVLNHFAPVTPMRAMAVGFLCWVGFAAPTSFATAIFSQTPKPLWLINSGYNLVSFVAAALLLGAWR